MTVSCEELEDFAAKYENREKTYGNLNLKYTADDDIQLLNRRAKDLFPRFRVRPQREDVQLIETGELKNPYNPAETVHQYLEAQFGDEPEMLSELKRRADELILEVENAFEKN